MTLDANASTADQPALVFHQEQRLRRPVLFTPTTCRNASCTLRWGAYGCEAVDLLIHEAADLRPGHSLVTLPRYCGYRTSVLIWYL
jgi:hypothetical protein